MDVAPWVWWTTIAVTSAILLSSTSSSSAAARTSRRMTRGARSPWRSTSGWRCVFGIGVWCFAGGRSTAREFFAGWLTEYSLSIDNLFIFIIIMGKFAVPRQLPADRAAGRHRAGAGHARHLHRRRRRGDQQLQLGLLPLRRCSCVYTAVKLAKEGGEDEDEYEENRLVRVGRAAPAGDRGVARHQAVRPARTASG